MSKAYKWPIEVQLHHPTVTGLALSPDGQQLVYAVEEPILRDDESKFVSHLYLARQGSDPIQLTYGDYTHHNPQWSPDGQYLAFISDRTGKPNLYVMRPTGGEAWALTRYDKSAVGQVVWSADGTRLAFLMAPPPTEAKATAKKQKNDAIRWDYDFEFNQIFLVDFALGGHDVPEAIQLTSGRFHITNVVWMPDGESLAITHMPDTEANQWPETTLATVPAQRKDPNAPLSKDDLFLIDVLASFEPGLVVTPAGQIAAVKGESPPKWAFASHVAIYSPTGGAPQILAETPDVQPILFGCSADNSELYVAEVDGVATQFYALPTNGGPVRPLLTERRYAPIQCSNQAGQIATVTQWFDQAPTPSLVNMAAGTFEPVTAPLTPSDWPDAPLPDAEIINWLSTDGLEIEGILIYPFNYEPENPVPLILDIHGGPTGVFTATHLPTHYRYADVVGLAERGFAVLRVNPRGSSGYGKKFRFANYNDWGGMDYQDLMSGIDHLISRGVVDGERMGVLGWSYGGYMTSSIITQTDRFKAACVGAGVTNLMSFNGTADIAGFIPDYFTSEYWDDLEPYQEHSPMFNVRGVSTPTLIQHGEQDTRVPLSQGRELYNALKRQGVPTEMIIYPRQGHGVAEPRLKLDVKRRATAWLERWVLGKE